MNARRRATRTFLLVTALALGHALLTWPLARTAALFAGGGAVAFLGERLAIRLGLLTHHTDPRVAGVPVAVVLVWPAVVYGWYRIALLALPAGVAAAGLAAGLATLMDLVLDPRGVREGLWTYPPARVSRPRFRGVPWWNVCGWMVVAFAAAALPALLT